MARAIAKEKVRVEALTKANAAAFTSSQIEEAKRVERNYATTINEILNIRYRANARFDLYISKTLAANQEEVSSTQPYFPIRIASPLTPLPQHPQHPQHPPLPSVLHIN